MSSYRKSRLRSLRCWSIGVWLLAAAGCGTTELPISSTVPVATIAVVPASGTLRVGEALQLFADPRDERGRVLAGRIVSATSLSPVVASVSPDGVVTALSPGSSQILISGEGNTTAVSITVVPVVGPITECASPKPGWIWCDDFEQDRLRQYFEYGSNGGSFVRAAGVGYGGSTGLRARFLTAGQVDAGFLHLAFGKTPSPYFRTVDAGTAVYRDIYWRLYVRYPLGWIGGGGNKMSRAQSLVTTNFAQAMIAHVWSGSRPGDHVPVDRLGFDPASGIGWRGRLLTSSYNDFPNLTWLGASLSKTAIFDRTHTGRWYCIEARARLNDPGRSNGILELWIDDHPEARQTGLDWIGSFRGYGINAVYIENYWNDGAPQPQERYFDNFVVSTQRIGCLG